MLKQLFVTLVICSTTLASAAEYVCAVQNADQYTSVGELKQIKLETTSNPRFDFRAFYRRDWAINGNYSGLMRNCKALDRETFHCFSWQGWGSDEYVVRSQIEFVDHNPFDSNGQAPESFEIIHHKVYLAQGQAKVSGKSKRTLTCK